MPCALTSYDYFPFREPAQQQAIISNSTRFVATKLRCLSNLKIRSETSHEDPKLRQLLGHVSIYDNVRAWSEDNDFYNAPSSTVAPSIPADKQRSIDTPTSTSSPEYMQQPNTSLNYYYHLQVPSFQDFQAAIEAQLATVAQVAAAHLAVDVEEYDGQSETDSDYDSYDGDWSDDDADGHDSEASLTDIETIEADVEGFSECSSPRSLNQGWDFDDEDNHHQDNEDDEKPSVEDQWIVRPLTPLLATAIHF